MNTTINRQRVALLLRSARDMMNGHWIKGAEIKKFDNGFSYCAAGAIRNVPGFTDAERLEAEIVLAELILKNGHGAEMMEDRPDKEDWELAGRFDQQGYDDAFRAWRENIIFSNNDDDETSWLDVKSWFTAASMRLKRA